MKNEFKKHLDQKEADDFKDLKHITILLGYGVQCLQLLNRRRLVKYSTGGSKIIAPTAC